MAFSSTDLLFATREPNSLYFELSLRRTKLDAKCQIMRRSSKSQCQEQLPQNLAPQWGSTTYHLDHLLVRITLVGVGVQSRDGCSPMAPFIGSSGSRDRWTSRSSIGTYSSNCSGRSCVSWKDPKEIRLHAFWYAGLDWWWLCCCLCAQGRGLRVIGSRAGGGLGFELIIDQAA